MLEDFFHVSSRSPPTTSTCLHKLLFPHNTCFVTTAGGTQLENVHAHIPHKVRTKEKKKYTRGLSCTRNKQTSFFTSVLFFLSLVLVCFSSFFTRGSQEVLCREGRRPPPLLRGLCCTGNVFSIFWPGSKFIPHAQTHMHHARTHVNTNDGEAETSHQKGVKPSTHSVCLWHQHLRGVGDHNLHCHDDAYFLSTPTNMDSSERG